MIIVIREFSYDMRINFELTYIIREQLSTVKSRFEYDKLGGWASVI